MRRHTLALLAGLLLAPGYPRKHATRYISPHKAPGPPARRPRRAAP
jgi:hypothetical protein